jgi:hypothetical protein
MLWWLGLRGHIFFGFFLHFQDQPIMQRLRVDLPDYVKIQSGPAGLLCHRRDEKIWNLESFMVRGSLERSDEGWLFQPKEFVSGVGGGVVGLLKFVRNGRRRAKNHLKKRQLERPAVPWEKSMIWEEIEQPKETDINL